MMGCTGRELVGEAQALVINASLPSVMIPRSARQVTPACASSYTVAFGLTLLVVGLAALVSIVAIMACLAWLLTRASA